MAKSKRKPTPARTNPAPMPTRRTAARPVPAKDGETPFRMAVAERSRGLIVLLSRQPQFLIPALMVLLMIVGLVAPLAYGVPALLLIVLFVSWLAFLSWPVIDSRQRAVRVLMIAVVSLALVARVAGWLD